MCYGRIAPLIAGHWNSTLRYKIDRNANWIQTFAYNEVNINYFLYLYVCIYIVYNESLFTAEVTWQFCLSHRLKYCVFLYNSLKYKEVFGSAQCFSKKETPPSEHVAKINQLHDNRNWCLMWWFLVVNRFLIFVTCLKFMCT